MRLGPFVTSRAPMGGQSAAAQQNVGNKISRAQNQAANTSKFTQLGDQMLQVGLANDLNRGRMAVAKKENEARSLIEQNPDYIDAEILEEMGVELNDSDILETEDGKRRVRTYTVAGEIYDRSVDAGMAEANSSFSFPSVNKRLNNEVDMKYRTEGRSALDRWAVGKAREVSRAEFGEQADTLRENGQYEEVMALAETQRAAGNISDAEFNNQLDVTSVAREMRDTNNTIIAAQRDYSKVDALKAKIEKYEEYLADGGTPANGMDTDKVFAERNRMLGQLTAIENAYNTKQTVRISNELRELSAAVDAIPRGLASVSMGDISRHEAQLAQMVQNGWGTDSQREQYQYKISEAKVVAANSPLFTAINSGNAEEALAARDELQRRAKATAANGLAPEAMILLNKTDQQFTRRTSMLSENPARAVLENDTSVQEARQALNESQGDINAIGDYLAAQKAAQARMGVPIDRMKAFDADDPWLTKLTETTEYGTWEAQREMLDVLTALPPDLYSLMTRSISGNDKDSATLQMALHQYPTNPGLARDIMQGRKMKDIPVQHGQVRQAVVDSVGGTIDPRVLDGSLPAIESAYKAGVAAGKYPADEFTPEAAEEITQEIFGPEVDFSTGIISFNDDKKLFSASGSTRSWQDPDTGQWVPPDEAIKQLATRVRTSDREFSYRGRNMSLEKIVKRGSLSVVGNGKYRIDFQQIDGSVVPLGEDGIGMGAPFILDMTQ